MSVAAAAAIRAPTMLLGTRTDMEPIAEASRKIQAQAGKLAKA